MDYVDYSAWDGHGSETDWAEAVDQFLQRSQRQQHDRLADELEQIAEQLAERDELHAEIVADLEWKIDRYTDQLEQLSRVGRDTGEGRRGQLKDRITAFYRELRNEQREHWRDRQELEREQRDIRRELAELEETDLSELL
ncbi:hypothetical protein [Natrinema sp. 1APR25-10V2]|uniref:hypothetical protein n=1 Tax=Natrinema sp. 1APR25-10V2 TaxID=2951081 RepID=UPI002874CFB2|nr:hypothetical protein [Natrinema sp. 1APR25-10V2]MDS0476849.1 hypothetical protein [Natrinema sp. 1APR25-10V2]